MLTDDDVESIKDWSAQRRRADRAIAPLCPVCGTNVIDTGRVLCARPVYCSNACKQRAYRKRVKTRRTK